MKAKFVIYIEKKDMIQNVSPITSSTSSKDRIII